MTQVTDFNYFSGFNILQINLRLMFHYRTIMMLASVIDIHIKIHRMNITLLVPELHYLYYLPRKH